MEQTASKYTRDNFSFSAKAILGTFLQPTPAPYATEGEYIRMTDIEVAKRLEELKLFTRQSLNVEQRIEIARQQQAARDAKKLAKEEMAKNKEKVRHIFNQISYLNLNSSRNSFNFFRYGRLEKLKRTNDWKRSEKRKS